MIIDLDGMLLAFIAAFIAIPVLGLLLYLYENWRARVNYKKIFGEDNEID